MKYLLGKTTIAGKGFDNAVVTKIPVGITGYYGGNVNYYGKTKEGFLLCLYKNTNKVMDICIDEDLLTDEGKKLLGMKQPKPPKSQEVAEPNTTNEPDISQLDRKELMALAKKLEIEGKIATMKSADLITAINEKQG